MLIASRLLYTRTLSKDYRWVQIGDKVDEKIKNDILNIDMTELLNKEQYYVSTSHTVVRRCEKNIVMYYFENTNTVDNYKRPIRALNGIVFSGKDAECVQMILPMLCAYYEILKRPLAVDYNGLTDEDANINTLIKIDLNALFDLYKDNQDFYEKVNLYSSLIKATQSSSFIIAENKIKNLNDLNSRPNKAVNTIAQQNQYGVIINRNIDGKANVNVYANANAMINTDNEGKNPSKKWFFRKHK